jgi:hypothetical protein
MKKTFFTLVTMALLLFSGFVNATYAKVLFVENFDSQADWWPIMGRPGGTCTDGVQATKCIPPGWSAWRNDEQWNPFDPVYGVPGSHPTVQISGENHFGPTGKALTIWNESNLGWAGDGWGADGILAKKLDQDYNELYVQFKIKFQPGFQWHWTVGGNPGQLKLFRLDHVDAGAASLFSNFEYGTNAPIAMIIIANGQASAGVAPNFGASNQFRCDPQNWDYINYLGNSYKCINNNVASSTTLPTNTTYWNVATYNSSYPAWRVGNNYYSSNYYCNRDHPTYTTGVPFVNSSKVADNSFQHTLGDGNWHTLLVHSKINSAIGVADGIYELFEDGNLLLSQGNMEYVAAGGTPGIGWNAVSFGGNSYNLFSDPANKAEQWYTFDDIVISTTKPDATNLR